ncbi:MAG: hypothetical protein KZQ83_14850 [gamma proteobacterium symbiont of Taylorina sp.]|nr:hypothetical protein [gamma proteobacterium symbiont of Taylorina sp.]
MPSIEVKGLDEVIKGMEEFGKQGRFALALGMTNTAMVVEAAEINEIGRVFDRPTRYTLNSLYVKPATKTRLQSVVKIKDFSSKAVPPSKYLYAQVHGGARSYKRFEVLLQNIGILPKGMYLVPGYDARLNQYGNITRAMIQKILSDLGAQFDNRQNSWGSEGKYFVDNSSGKFHIYQHVGGDLKSIMFGVRNTNYKKRFDFYGVGMGIANKHLVKEIDKALIVALDTAWK